jgi:hypothetical protein
METFWKHICQIGCTIAIAIAKTASARAHAHGSSPKLRIEYGGIQYDGKTPFHLFPHPISHHSSSSTSILQAALLIALTTTERFGIYL